LSTTNPTWTDPGSNPGLRGERPATNRLSHATALEHELIKYLLMMEEKYFGLRRQDVRMMAFNWLRIII
jgi:hypothetical protein